jgi:hypothetical protein
MRGENSSDESEDERSESDDSVEDHTSDSAVGGSPPNSEDDPSENRRPGRGARTRANVVLLFLIIAYAN